MAREGDGDVIYLTDGHCRYEAVQLVIQRGGSIETLPVVVKPNSCSMEDLTVALVVSNSGKPLTPYELGQVCKRLVGFGWDAEKIAERLQISEQYAEQLLSLMGAPAEIRKMVQAGEVSAAIAVEMLRKHAGEAVALLRQAQSRASESGSKKVTAKHLPGAKLKKVLTKQAPVMRDTLREVCADPAYAGLHEDLRNKLEQLLQASSDAESDSVETESSDTTTTADHQMQSVA